MEYEIKKTRLASPFKIHNWKPDTKGISCNMEYTVTRNGVKHNLYQLIQDGREDTEIMPTLEKYGCIDRMVLNREMLYGDFTEMGDLRTIKEQQMKATEMWAKLPQEVKHQFNNDKYEFAKNGLQWLKDTEPKPEVTEPDVTTQPVNPKPEVA